MTLEQPRSGRLPPRIYRVPLIWHFHHNCSSLSADSTTIQGGERKSRIEKYVLMRLRSCGPSIYRVITENHRLPLRCQSHSPWKDDYSLGSHKSCVPIKCQPIRGPIRPPHELGRLVPGQVSVLQRAHHVSSPRCFLGDKASSTLGTTQLLYTRFCAATKGLDAPQCTHDQLTSRSIPSQGHPEGVHVPTLKLVVSSVGQVNSRGKTM